MGEEALEDGDCELIPKQAAKGQLKSEQLARNIAKILSETQKAQPIQ
jgi:hypothetical protein